ncbi:hypothetical protein [Woodsholea maritima]|uniref:hypothetical protein n=1 Tax=Woodsholea maritima TaxID=240237 RepID=UPI0003803160
MQSIASRIWGDSALWYKIAEANGLSGQSQLIEGQSLLLPTGVMRNTYNATTFTPCDPNKAIGDLTPSSPSEPRPVARKGKKGCGGIGQIFMVVIAVAVSVVTQNWLVAHTAIKGLAAGSIASQAFGVATGIQDKFSWNAVAMAGISAGITGGVGPGSTIAGAAVRGAAANALGQGVGIAMGWQDKFSWSGVAAAGVMAGVGQRVSGSKFVQGLDKPWQRSIVTGGARAVSGAATRSLIDGTSFGDNVLAVLPDVIGQTIGESIGGALLGAGGFSPNLGSAQLDENGNPVGDAAGHALAANAEAIDGVRANYVASANASRFAAQTEVITVRASRRDVMIAQARAAGQAQLTNLLNQRLDQLQSLRQANAEFYAARAERAYHFGKTLHHVEDPWGPNGRLTQQLRANVAATQWGGGPVDTTGIHLTLAALGMVEGFGIVADLADAALYAYEGDYVNAAASALSIVPGVGLAIGAKRIATLTHKLASGARHGGNLGEAAARSADDVVGGVSRGGRRGGTSYSGGNPTPLLKNGRQMTDTFPLRLGEVVTSAGISAVASGATSAGIELGIQGLLSHNLGRPIDWTQVAVSGFIGAAGGAGGSLGKSGLHKSVELLRGPGGARNFVNNSMIGRFATGFTQGGLHSGISSAGFQYANNGSIDGGTVAMDALIAGSTRGAAGAATVLDFRLSGISIKNQYDASAYRVNPSGKNGPFALNTGAVGKALLVQAGWGFVINSYIFGYRAVDLVL